MPDRAKTVVLVVEHEPLILMDAMQSPEDAGFEVVNAMIGATAGYRRRSTQVAYA